MSNIFRQAYEIVTTKTSNQMTDDEIELVNRALFPIINLLPRLDRRLDEMPVSEGLLLLAELIEREGDNSRK